MNKTFGILVFMLVGSMLMFGCTSNTISGNSANEQVTIDTKSTIEQKNIANRIEIENSPSTTMWLYGLSETGNVIFRSVVSGKVTSSGKRLDPIQSSSSDCDHKIDGNVVCTYELKQTDGAYGQSDQYIFWFDNVGNYYQWNGMYIISTKPLRIQTPLIDIQQQNESG